MLAGSLTQEDEDAVLAELEAITQGDVTLPDVPSDQLPDVPEAAEQKPGVCSGSDVTVKHVSCAERTVSFLSLS